MSAFTWILVLPLLQLFGVTVYTFDTNIVCGGLPLKDCLLLYPNLEERPNLTRFLDTIPSATLVQNSEDPDIVQVFSDPKDWEKIYRYAVDRGFYLGHVARRVDEDNSEFPELEQLLSIRYKPRSLAVNEPVGHTIDQDSVEGRGDHGKMVVRSSGTETFNNERRFQRLVRETDETTDESKDESKKNLKKKGAESKRKTTGKDSRRKSAKKSVSKTGRRNDDATPESPLEDKAARCKDHETTGRSSKMQKGSSGTRNAKSRSGRSIADSSEIEGSLRVARDDSDADDSTLRPDELEEETRKRKSGDKKAKGLGSGKRGSISKASSGRSISKTTEAPTKRKMSGGALTKKKAQCKKGGKRCKLADEEDEEEEVTSQTTDEPSTTETDEEMDKTTEEVEESRQHEHMKFLDCPPMIPPEPLGRLADYIHRIFNWIKKLETGGLRG